MTARDSLKDKIIIVAEHNEASSRLIDSTLKNHGFSNIRHANTGESMYEILRLFYNQPEKIGLIVFNEHLPQCEPVKIQQSLCLATESTAIPFINLCDEDGDGLTGNSNIGQPVNDGDFSYTMSSPINPQELLLAVNFLLKLRMERLRFNAEKQQLAIELSAKNVSDAKLKYLVSHDELTGLLNRSNFERRLKLALNRSYLQHKDAALLFIEVDRFCLINEMKGFDAGDRLLVELTVFMRKLAPPNSLFARVGSNEFCLFLEDMSKPQAQRYAEEFKSQVENYGFYFDEAKHSVTLSIGL